MAFLDQQLFNIGITIIGLLGGWFLRVFDDSLKELRHQLIEMTEKLQATELLVAGEYVRRDDLEKSIAAIFTKLDRIESKLDKKVDK